MTRGAPTTRASAACRTTVVRATTGGKGYSVDKQITDLTISTHRLIQGLQRQIVEQRERIDRLERRQR